MSQEKENENALVPEFPSLIIHTSKTSETSAYCAVRRRLVESPPNSMGAVAIETRYDAAKPRDKGGRYYVSGDPMELAQMLTCDWLHGENGQRCSKQLFNLLRNKSCAHELIPDSVADRSFPVDGYIDIDIDEIVKQSKKEEFAKRNILPDKSSEMTLVQAFIDFYVEQLKLCLGDSFPRSVLDDRGNIPARDIVLLRGSRPGKFSWHVVFKTLIWESNYHQSEFVRDFILPKLSTTEPFSSYYGALFDERVTKAFGTLRMWNCHHAITIQDFDNVRNCVREGVVVYPLELMSPLPYKSMSPEETLLWTSISLDVPHAPNCIYASSEKIQAKPFRKDREAIINEKLASHKLDESDKFVMNVLNVIEHTLFFSVVDEITHERKRYAFTDLWPRADMQSVKSRYKQFNDDGSFTFDKQEYKKVLVEFHYKSKEGTVCLRKGNNIFNFERHEGSSISIILKGNGTVNQACWAAEHPDPHYIWMGNFKEMMAQYITLQAQATAKANRRKQLADALLAKPSISKST